MYDLSPGLQQNKTTVSVVELELLILPEHMSLLTVLGGVRVGRSLVFLQQRNTPVIICDTDTP